MKIISMQPIVTALAAILLIFPFRGSVQAQEITGQWNGVLNIQGMSLRLTFHIQKSETAYSATMDSPDQGVTGIAVSSTTFDGKTLQLSVPSINLTYEGTLAADSITGTFRQSGMSLPLTLKRTEAKKPVIRRPQEPVPEYPYRVEEVRIENRAAGITLAGTLTMPAEGSGFAAVILITGSGPQNRDEELMGHKPFLVIADYLTRQGIAVLRCDDRGTAQSTGDFRTATTADFATDAESALEWLKTRKEIDRKKIGLMGHSEGGVIAPMVAARSEDVAFVVMLAGPGIRGDRLMLSQERLVYAASGMQDSEIATVTGINAKVFDRIVQAEGTGDVPVSEIVSLVTAMKDGIAGVMPEGITADAYISQFAAQVSSPWMQYFIRHDPAPALEKVTCPVLAVNGSRDLQVPARENLDAVEAALHRGGNRRVTVKEYPGLNHLFQECTTGLPTEYAVIEQTFSPDVLGDLAKWITEVTD